LVSPEEACRVKNKRHHEPQEVHLDENEKALVLGCAKVMEAHGEEKLQEAIDFIISEGGNDQVLVMKATAPVCAY
jgi:hypothetical protein